MVTIYQIVSIPHIVDGDTLWVQRERSVGDVGGVELIERDYRGGRKVRLHDGKKGLNTPEVNRVATKVAGLAARHDLENFIADWGEHDLELWSYGVDDFGRLLGDLHVIDHPSDTYGAVSYMLGRGWESYK
jgi:endonuclease YncB( thermonuclease family)